ncbi:MAG: winged helix-turn-helix domain-containing protein [Acidobacteria bacterium]|nr:winged helix-turn-helix domain-containing protein [Acidobacteriota bacterium]
MAWSFGVFQFDEASLELTREGRRVALEPQPARALARLLAAAGDVVSREEMRQAIWGAETHVDYDRGLAYCIGQVRAALGDSAEQPRFVQTLPKRGFRFLAPVTRGRDRDAAAGRAGAPALSSPAPAFASPPAASPPAPFGARRWMLAAALLLTAGLAALGWRTAATARPAVVAVSVFDNETGDAAHDAFVAGLPDLVVTELTNLAPGRVGVVGNAAALRQPRNIRNLKALAAAVDADYVVLGQLQRQDERLRFIVHFIRLSDGVHLSAQRFVRPPGDVAAFEADVLGEAVHAVRRFVLASGTS